jgi:hypothetical protein
MATANATAISYSGQFSNQTLPIIAFSAALRALHKKMGVVRWIKNKDIAGINSTMGAQIPIPFVGRIATETVTPGATPNAATSLTNATRYMVLDSWIRNKGIGITGQEMSIFNTSSIVPRGLERAVQAVAEAFEQDAANLAYAFPAVYGSSNIAAFATSANSIPLLRKAMSLNLCPNSDPVGLFLSTTDAWTLKTTDDYKKNPQLAALARAEEQYGKATLGEILGTVLFENQFMGTRTPGNYASANVTVSAAAAVAQQYITANTSANIVIKKGDAFKVAATGAPEGFTYFAAAAAANISANTPANITITQPLEFAVSANAVITPTTTDAAAYSFLENLAITPDALGIGNRIMVCDDIAEQTGNAWNVQDSDSPENDYQGTGLIFTMKRFPESYQALYEVSIFYGIDYLDTRLGGRLLSLGVAL